MLKNLFRSGWFYCFAFTLLLFVAQQEAVFGFFLSFFNPELWSILFINLGFVLMGWQGFSRNGARWMKIVPGSWFGGYFVAALVSHALASHFYSQIDAWNATQKVRWNRKSDVVAVAHSWSDENRGVVFDAKDLVQRYGLDQAIDASRDADAQTAIPYGRSWLVQEACGPRDFQSPIQRSFVTRGGGREPFQLAGNLCLLSEKEFAPRALVMFVNRGINGTDVVLDRDVEDIDVSTTDGAAYHLKAAWTRPLTWFPKPIFGCIRPGYSPPSWCGFKFSRESNRQTARTPERVITDALGLQAVPLEQRFPRLQWEDFQKPISKQRRKLAP